MVVHMRWKGQFLLASSLINLLNLTRNKWNARLSFSRISNVGVFIFTVTNSLSLYLFLNLYTIFWLIGDFPQFFRLSCCLHADITSSLSASATHQIGNQNDNNQRNQCTADGDWYEI